MKFRFFSAVFLVVLFLFGCKKSGKITQLEREDLFALDIGKLEDQVALFSLEGDRGIRRAGIVMKDGLFYISDGSGGKVLRYNSYGDLLFMIYNEETNPPPMTLKHLSDENLVTRWAVSYPLLEPGEIAVDSRKHIYVQDLLPYERYSFDTESKALLNTTILHFDADGKFLEYLGREGIGGSPFPKIEGLYTSVRDELAVICRLPEGWDIYWYNSEGLLLFVVQLKSDILPLPPDRDAVFPSLDLISAAPDGRILYIKIDYYRYTFDESTNMRTGIEPDGSVIWLMNVENGAWEKYVDLPFFEYSFTEQNKRNTVRTLYSLLGVINDGWAFLSFPVEGGYSILVMPTDSSGEQYKSFIRVDNEELQFNAFNLSTEGILSGLLVDDWQAKLVWWRTDKLFGDSSQ
jgi:hypothetical protein